MDSERMHLGRCWAGDEREWFQEQCTCTEVAPCGAVVYDPSGTCPQHNNGAKTIRRLHKESACTSQK